MPAPPPDALSALFKHALKLAGVVTAKTQYSLANAEGYFAEHLSVGDYYDEGQKTSGQWFGQGVQSLGLAARVEANAFLALCGNKDPKVENG